MRRVGFAVLVFLLCSANSCDSDKRSAEKARVDAIRMLNAPVICDGSEAAGWICGTNAGRLVWCPARERSDCELIPTTNPAPVPLAPLDTGSPDARPTAEKEP